MPTSAIFVGLQAGFRKQPPIELYNLIAPVGVHPAGSTVSRQTLEKHGVPFSPAPLLRKSRRSSGAK